MSQKVTRLFGQFQPEHYELALVPDREAMTFSGAVTVRGRKVGRPSQRLTFHQKELKIISATVVKHDKKGDTTLELSRINNQNSLNEVRLHAADMVYPGEYTITMAFEGRITNTMVGIYPCAFKYDGQDKKLIATQFESHHAREAFPCIDEPEAKATFDLTLTTPKGEQVLANTPIKSQKTAGQHFVTTFERTPRMSTYLLAFVYGAIHGVEGESKRGIAVRSWATVAHPKSHLKYANAEAIKLLDFFEDYFNTPFPLIKFDQIALPDFEVGAMENWGLVTFREVTLLADPVNRSISSERLVTSVVAHEMSHQWFGNLVTMKWWDDLWLNESFASIMESLAPDKLHPDWQEWEDFTASRVIGAANRDVYKDVQSVGVVVNHPDEIFTLFDPAIVYAKGARILKMLLDFIGPEAFQKGLTSYFKRHAYGNTTREDLWAELTAASGIDVGALMTPWIEQSGTPELIVSTHNGKVELAQQRFLLDGDDAETLWPIPLLADTEVKPNILKSKHGALNGKRVPLFNPEGSGHFITRYENRAARESLCAKIIDRSVPTAGRIIALNDMLLLTQKGTYQLIDVLDIVAQCDHEDRDGVWSMFGRAIGSAQVLVEENESAEEKLRAFRCNLAAHWYKKLGWQDGDKDDVNTKHLRTTMLAMSVGGEDPAAVKTALGIFADAGSADALPAEQRGIIASAAVRFGKPSYIKQLINEYESTANPDVKESIAAALCSTRDEAVGRQLIRWGMYDDRVIRQQDISHWFAYLMRNHHTRKAAWNWLEERWQFLIDSGQKKSIETFIWYSSRALSTSQWQKRYQTFFKPKADDPLLQRNILVSLAEIQARVAWRERNEAAVKNWLEQHPKT